MWGPKEYAPDQPAQLIHKIQDLQAYAFPPFALIGRCLQKIRQERATVVLIAPVWPTEAWYPWLPEMLMQCPILLPSHRSLLQDPFDREHPLLIKKQLELAAWKVSGVPTQVQAFQAELQRLSRQGGGKEPIQPISQAGLNGPAGVIEGVSIPFM